MAQRCLLAKEEGQLGFSHGYLRGCRPAVVFLGWLLYVCYFLKERLLNPGQWPTPAAHYTER